MACAVTQVGCSSCGGSAVSSSPQMISVASSINPMVFYESGPEMEFREDEEDISYLYRPRRLVPHPLVFPKIKMGLTRLY